jgi:hypothetical protein
MFYGVYNLNLSQFYVSIVRIMISKLHSKPCIITDESLDLDPFIRVNYTLESIICLVVLQGLFINLLGINSRSHFVQNFHNRYRTIWRIDMTFFASLDTVNEFLEFVIVCIVVIFHGMILDNQLRTAT